jgi:hypothetical protein
VGRKLELASVTAKDVERLRDGYRPVAERGAILFFVLLDMARVNPMYQYSLSAYMGVVVHSLRKALPDTVLSKRLTNIITTLTKAVYDYGCTGECKYCGVVCVTRMACSSSDDLQSLLITFKYSAIADLHTHWSSPGTTTKTQELQQSH